MSVTYATYSEFSRVYNVPGVSAADISSYFLQAGALRVNEALGGYFTTPFSSNNETAKDLSIKYTLLEILSRNRGPQVENVKVREDVDGRVEDIRKGNSPMILSDGESLFASTTKVDAYSTTQDYNSTFTMLDPISQQVDPDLKKDLYNDLKPYDYRY